MAGASFYPEKYESVGITKLPTEWKKMFQATNQKSNGNIYTSLIGSNKFYGDTMAIHGGNSIIRTNQVSITNL